jgi:hypothetical protein
VAALIPRAYARTERRTPRDAQSLPRWGAHALEFTHESLRQIDEGTGHHD